MTTSLRIVYAGTPEFAVPALAAFYAGLPWKEGHTPGRGGLATSAVRARPHHHRPRDRARPRRAMALWFQLTEPRLGLYRTFDSADGRYRVEIEMPYVTVPRAAQA